MVCLSTSYLPGHDFSYLCVIYILHISIIKVRKMHDILKCNGILFWLYNYKIITPSSPLCNGY